MHNFTIKTIVLKVCRRCAVSWSGERIQLEEADQVNITTMKIAYCPACADSMAEETDRPTYRREGKRVR